MASSYSFKPGLLFLISIFIFGVQSYAQISLTATAGITTGSYTTLKSCFDAINLGFHQGDIQISITGSTVETATAELDSSGVLSNYVSVTILPTTTCSITGNIPGAVIKLDGADSVIIDGRIGGAGSVRSLTIQNTYDDSAAPAYALQLANKANRNIIRYTILEGIGQTSQSNATIYLYGPNKNNLISNNDIGPVAGQLQNSGIMADDARNLTISYNNVHDFVSHGSGFTAAGIDVKFAKNCTILGNSIYQIDPVTLATPFNQMGIWVYYGSGNVIAKNYIGGSAPEATGGPMVYSGYYSFSGISATETDISIDSNIITNIKVVNDNALYRSVVGITVQSDSVEIGLNAGNIIGSISDTSAIITYNASLWGILYGGTSYYSFVDIQNNKIGGLTINGDNITVGGIYVYDADEGFVLNNTIGGPGSRSLQFRSSLAQGYGIGISTDGSSVLTCDGNTIRNLYGYGGSGSNISLYGICNGIDIGSSTSSFSKRLLSHNTITSLEIESDTGTATINGIYSGPLNSSSSYNNMILGNNIQDFSLSGGSGSSISGILNESPYSISLDIDSNIIKGMVSNAPNVNSSLALAVQGIGLLSSSNNAYATISFNLISDLASTSTAATNVAGINSYHSINSNPLVISCNRMYGLAADSAIDGSVNGLILASSGSGSFEVKNNMIGLNAIGSRAYGIVNNTGVSNLNLHYNSVYLSGTTSGSGVSAAFSRLSNSAGNLVLKDNIFENVRDGGNGNYAVINSYPANPANNWAYSDYNNFYCGDTGTTVLWGTSALTFADYRSLTLKDSSSTNITAEFVYPDTADLHLTADLINQQLTGNAVPGITTDFDNDLRHPTPAMGADEILVPQTVRVSELSNPLASGFRVYPNPFSDLIICEMAEPADQLQFCDIAGKLVKTYTIRSRGESISASNLPSGCYILKIYNSKGKLRGSYPAIKK